VKKVSWLLLAGLVLVVWLLQGVGPACAGKPKKPKDLGDLKWYEDNGGHMLARHVGKTPKWCTERLTKDPKIAAASSFSNEGIAKKVVSTALKANEKKINEWIKKKGSEGNLVLKGAWPSNIGFVVKRLKDKKIDPKPVYVRKYLLVLKHRKDLPTQYIVLTGYPEQ